MKLPQALLRADIFLSPSLCPVRICRIASNFLAIADMLTADIVPVSETSVRDRSRSLSTLLAATTLLRVFFHLAALLST